MATVATLPFAKVPKGYTKESKERSSKSKQPTRSMTHPIHDPAKPPSKRHIKNGEPFDPEELTRRLTAYVTEQKLAQQRRREARAAKERAAAAALVSSPTDGVYHHVPVAAAAAFQRTATPNIVTPETVHKLAAPVLKAALSPNIPDETFNSQAYPTRQKSTKRPTTSLQRTVMQDQAEVERERVRNRNQFQRTQGDLLDEAAEADELRDVYRLPQRTFVEFAHLRNGGYVKGHSRPLSTGDVFSDSEDTDTQSSGARLKSLKVKPSYDGRNDWAQKEDGEKSPVEKGRTVKERVSGLRRKDSIWVLMGKKEKEKDKTKQDESLVGTGVGACTSPPPIDGKKGFLARFKRHPS